MANEGVSCGMSNQQDQHALQDKEISERLEHIRNKILVMSGKGGVGKSSVAAYLAVALAKRGYKVGLMDVDLHGPSIPRLLGLGGQIQAGIQDGKARPVKYLPNMEVISMETLLGENKDVATIWRGPLKIGVIRQFISDIEWMDLDYLVIDSPPGTGDEPLTVAQTIPDAKALVVTTPQEISLADVRKSINFCRQVNMEILGLVENMSGLKCPHCGEIIDLFRAQGGMETAIQQHLALLGSLPLEPQVVQQGDIGGVAFLENEDLDFTQAFHKMVDRVVSLTEAGKHASPESAVSQVPEREVSPEGKKTLAIPVSAGKLSSHFGHSENFVLIETENGEIRRTESRTPPPHEPGVLPRWLHDQGANVIIAGGMGERARQMCNENGIEVVTGAPVDSPEILAYQYLTRTLVTGENVCDH
jgi:Mrp family chromosome partitioning ATPase/predicted Fe-Mo cluster-binding NifX family protein